MSEIVKHRIVDLMADGARIAAMLSNGADTDEEADAQLAEFNSWMESCDSKAYAAKIVIKALESEADRFKQAAKEIRERAASMEAQADKLRERTMGLLDAMETDKVTTPDGGFVRITSRSNLSVAVENEWDLPAGCTKTVVTPDNAAIKAYYKEHGACPGAVITESTTRSLTVK
jgi:hypothetical protein